MAAQLPIKPSTKTIRQSVLIVTAGHSKSGKSTALNSIFGTDFKKKCSASSVTKSVDARRVDRQEHQLITVDTVGLAATDINLDKVKMELLDAIGGLNFVLLYCFSIAPTSPHSVADEHVVKNLTKILGKGIWKKCVVLFTSSDVARMFEWPRKDHRDQYKKYIDDHAKRFNQLLRQNCGSDLHVKSVFKIDINAEKNEEIIAIPVGKELRQGDEVHKLTPGMKINWRALASCLIIKKAEPMDRGVYLAFMKRSILNNQIAAGILGAAAGGASGAVLGMGLGGFGGIPGVLIGLGTGAALGVVAGGAAGGAVGGATIVRNKLENMKIESRINRLQQAKHIDAISDHEPSDYENISIQNGAHIATDIEESYDVIKSTASKQPPRNGTSISTSLTKAGLRDPEDPDFPEEPDCGQSIVKVEMGRKLKEFASSYDPEEPDLTSYDNVSLQ